MCTAIAGKQSVTSGPEYDFRKILRLDADPNEANTIGGRGAGPATMALAIKAHWAGPEFGRTDRLKAELRRTGLDEREIDEDLDQTEAELKYSSGPATGGFEHYTPHELVNATSQARQQARKKKQTIRHGSGDSGQRKRPAILSGFVRKADHARRTLHGPQGWMCG